MALKHDRVLWPPFDNIHDSACNRQLSPYLSLVLDVILWRGIFLKDEEKYSDAAGPIGLGVANRTEPTNV